MPKEAATIHTTRYHDDQGRPTCAVNFETGESCEFHCTTKFGTVDTCIFIITEGCRRPSRLKRRDNGKGLLIPGDWCPLFKKDADVNDDYMKREDQITC